MSAEYPELDEVSVPSLLRLFNPKHTLFTGTSPRLGARAWIFLEERDGDMGWDRLETVLLKGFVVRGRYLAQLSFLRPSVVVSFDLTDHHLSPSYVERFFVDELVGEENPKWALLGSNVERVMVRVGSEDQKSRILEDVRWFFDVRGVEVEGRRRMDGLLRFEMVGEEEQVRSNRFVSLLRRVLLSFLTFFTPLFEPQ